MNRKIFREYFDKLDKEEEFKPLLKQFIKNQFPNNMHRKMISTLENELSK